MKSNAYTIIVNGNTKYKVGDLLPNSCPHCERMACLIVEGIRSKNYEILCQICGNYISNFKTAFRPQSYKKVY